MFKVQMAIRDEAYVAGEGILCREARVPSLMDLMPLTLLVSRHAIE